MRVKVGEHASPSPLIPTAVCTAVDVAKGTIDLVITSDIKAYIAEARKLLPVPKGLSSTEAERRAGAFLDAMAACADWKHEFTKVKIKQLSVQTAIYAQELVKGTGKTVTENKTAAEASAVYQTAREGLEETENDISYLKTYYEVFNNAHIFYRNLMKESSYG